MACGMDDREMAKDGRMYVLCMMIVGYLNLRSVHIHRIPVYSKDSLANVRDVAGVFAGGTAFYTVPVSYTHLTLPTKRIV